MNDKGQGETYVYTAKVMSSSMSTIISPPECMKIDDYAAAEPARQRLIAKPGFRLFASIPNLRRSASSSTKGKRPDTPEEPEDPIRVPSIDGDTCIHLDNSAIDESDDTPAYRWAILYENQRGCVFDFLHTIK